MTDLALPCQEKDELAKASEGRIGSLQDSNDHVPTLDLNDVSPGNPRREYMISSIPNSAMHISPLTDHGFVQTQFGMTALHLCVSKGDVRSVEILIEYGVDVDIVDSQKRTALHIACAMGSTAIVSILLRKEAKTELMDWNGHTALHLACLNENYEILGLLLKNGINPNTQVGGRL